MKTNYILSVILFFCFVNMVYNQSSFTTIWNKNKEGSFSKSVVDANGNLFVIQDLPTGGTGAGGANINSYIIKYNSAGTEQWSKDIQSGSEFHLSINDIGIDSNGDILVCGEKQSFDGLVSFESAYLSKLDANGNILWTKVIKGNDPRYKSNAYSLAVTSDKNIYVCGQSGGNLNGQTAKGLLDGFILKYQPNGTLEWTRLIGTSAEDIAYDVEIGEDNNSIYIAGKTNASLDGASHSGGSDAFITKYSSTGTRSWTRLLGTSNTEWGSGLAYARSSILLTGGTNGNLDGKPNSFGNATFITAFGATGDKKWTTILEKTKPLTSYIGTPKPVIKGSSSGDIYLASEYANPNNPYAPDGYVMILLLGTGDSAPTVRLKNSFSGHIINDINPQANGVFYLLGSAFIGGGFVRKLEEKKEEATLANLVCSSGDLSIQVSNGNSTVAVSKLKVTNSGTAAAVASKAGVYISKDAAITKSDQLLFSLNIEALAAGASALKDFSITPNVSLIPDGEYHIGIILDRESIIQESDETDNTFYWQTPKFIVKKAVEFLSVSTQSLEFGPESTEQEFQITSNTKWHIKVETFYEWMSFGKLSTREAGSELEGSNNDVISVICSDNKDTSTRTNTIFVYRLENGVERDKISIKLSQKGRKQGSSAPPWTAPEPSLINHTIAISTGLQSDINGNQLNIGDYIGFFYKSGDLLQVAGFAKWEGQNLLIDIVGDDSSTAPVEGYKPGDDFVVKVWRAEDQKEYLVSAAYAPIGTQVGNTKTDALGKFKNQALSAITKIETSNKATTELKLQAGWNLVSIPIKPVQPRFDSIFAPVASSIDLVRSIDKTFIPGFANTIGDWDPSQGYYIKAKKAINLTIEGTALDGEQKKIYLKEGWQYVAYWCAENQAVGEVFKPYASEITVVRDLTKSYVPNFSADDVFCMQPGQGYQVKGAKGLNQALIYDCSQISPCKTPFNAAISKSNKNKQITDNSAIVLFDQSMLKSLKVGSKIIALDESGGLVGEETFLGNNLVLTIWGDDQTSPDKDGLSVGERFFVHFQDEFGLPHPIEEMGITSFITNSYEVSQIYTAKLSTPNSTVKFSLAPNPTQNAVTLKTLRLLTTPIQLLDVQGRLIESWSNSGDHYFNNQYVLSLQGIPPGVYYVKASNSNEVFTEKLIIQY